MLVASPSPPGSSASASRLAGLAICSVECARRDNNAANNLVGGGLGLARQSSFGGGSSSSSCSLHYRPQQGGQLSYVKDLTYRNPRGSKAAARQAFVAAARSSMNSSPLSAATASAAAVAAVCSTATTNSSSIPNSNSSPAGKPPLARRPLRHSASESTVANSPSGASATEANTTAVSWLAASDGRVSTAPQAASCSPPPPVPSPQQPAAPKRKVYGFPQGGPPPPLPELVNMLASDVLMVRMQSLQFFFETCPVSEDARSGAVAGGVVHHLVGMLTSTMWFNSEAGLLSLRLLNALARESSGRATIIASGCLAAIAALLPKLQGDRLLQMLQLVLALLSGDAGGLSADRVRMELIHLELAPMLLELMQDHPVLVIRCLGECAKNKAAIPALMRLKTVSLLLAQLRSEQDEVVLEAEYTLSVLSCTNDSRNLIYEDGALPTVCDLMKHSNPQVQAGACAVLAALAGRDPRGHGSYSIDPTKEEEVDDIGTLPLDAQIFIEADVVSTLVPLLSHGNATVQEEALHAIMQLCPIERLQTLVLAQEALPKLIELLHCGTILAQGYAGTTLRLLACTPERLEEIEAAVPTPSSTLNWTASDDEKQRAIVRKLRHYCF